METPFHQVNAWLRDLGNQYGMPLSLNEEGSCALIGDQDFELEIFAQDACDHFFINIKIMDLPHGNRADILYQAMTLNLFQQETLGGSLAVDPKNESLMYCYSREIEQTTFSCFANIVGNLLDTASKLRDGLSQVEATSFEGVPETMSPHDMTNMYAVINYA